MRWQHGEVVDDGFYSSDGTGVVAGEGAGGGIGGGSAEGDDAVADSDLDVLPGECAFVLQFCLYGAGELLVGGSSRLAAASVTCEEENGQERCKREGLSHDDSFPWTLRRNSKGKVSASAGTGI